MSLADRKITSTDITSKGVVAAPDTMTGTAQENKMVFDRLIREVVKEDMNGVIDDLMASTAAAEIGFDTPEDMTADNVQDAIEEIKDDTETGVAKAIAEALKSEGYAVGKQNGVDVESGSTYYHNNSKYYSEQASGSADTATAQAGIATTKAGNASDSATAASGYANDALGYRNTAEAHKNDASDYKDAASASALSASGSATAAGNSETNASAKALVSEGYALGKQNGIDVEEGSEYYHNNAKYFKEQAGEASVGYVSYASAQSIPTSGKLQARTNIDAEDFGNKVTSVNSSSSDTQYPSAKLLYDTKTALESADSTLNLNKADRADVHSLINIWDEQYSKMGSYLTNQGVETTHGSWNISSYIPVDGGKKYYFHNVSDGATSASYCWYDVNKAFISGANHGAISYEVTAPSNAKYLRSSIRNGNTEISINYPSTYTGYYPSALPRTNAHVSGLGNAIGMRGWNQLVQNGNFANSTNGWEAESSAVTISASNNILTVVSTAYNVGVRIASAYRTLNTPVQNHVYLFSFDYKGPSAKIKCFMSQGFYYVIDTSSDFVKHGVIAKFTGSTDTFAFNIYTLGDNTCYIKNCMCIDLTALFGAGNEPSSVSDFRAMFPADYYPYCSGGFADLLWTNASPTASFSAQNVSIDFSGYRFLLIIGLYKNSTVTRGSVIIPIKQSVPSTLYIIDFDTNSRTTRKMVMGDNYIAFAAGYTITTTATSDNNSAIPYKIYGVR